MQNTRIWALEIWLQLQKERFSMITCDAVQITLDQIRAYLPRGVPSNSSLRVLHQALLSKCAALRIGLIQSLAPRETVCACWKKQRIQKNTKQILQ